MGPWTKWSPSMVSGRGTLTSASGGAICLFYQCRKQRNCGITSYTVNWNPWNNEQSVANSCAQCKVGIALPAFTLQPSWVMQRSVSVAVKGVRERLSSIHVLLSSLLPCHIILYIYGNTLYGNQAWTFRETNHAIYLLCRTAQFFKNDFASRSSYPVPGWMQERGSYVCNNRNR
jgi:hypothetical protein